MLNNLLVVTSYSTMNEVLYLDTIRPCMLTFRYMKINYCKGGIFNALNGEHNVRPIIEKLKLLKVKMVHKGNSDAFRYCTNVIIDRTIN